MLVSVSLEQGAKSEVFYFQTTGHMGTGLVLSVSVQLPACPFGLRLRACVCVSVSNSPRLLILWGPVKGLGWAWCLSGSPAYPNDQSEGFLQPSECGGGAPFSPELCWRSASEPLDQINLLVTIPLVSDEAHTGLGVDLNFSTRRPLLTNKNNIL